MLRYLLMVAVLGACGGSVDTDIEDQITIEQGIYGLLISGCDTSGCQDQPAAGEHVIVYAAGSKTGPFVQAVSDNNGVYQINLVAGDYTLCTYSCTEASVPANGKIRFDWISGPGGGHWSD
ncbi:MAG TPA: hypothetical protein VIV11_34745 [Kofleriaceae bacterium]